MKKIFLIAGVVACVCATNAYAARDKQNANVTKFDNPCATGCKYKIDVSTDPETGIVTMEEYCSPKDKCKAPWSSDAAAAVQGAKKIAQETAISEQSNVGVRPTRAAKVMVPQKIVYKEIYFDDSVDVIEE